MCRLYRGPHYYFLILYPALSAIYSAQPAVISANAAEEAKHSTFDRLPTDTLDEDDWSDVPVEDDSTNTTGSLAEHVRIAETANATASTGSDTRGGNHLKDLKTPVTAEIVSDNAQMKGGESEEFEESADLSVPLEGAEDVVLKSLNSKESEIDLLKKLAEQISSMGPEAKWSKLSKKNILLGKEEKEAEKDEKRRSKCKEEKLFERLRKNQREKYGDQVELAEQQAVVKKERFKDLREWLDYFHGILYERP